jgi:hypothetical protein
MNDCSLLFVMCGGSSLCGAAFRLFLGNLEISAGAITVTIRGSRGPGTTRPVTGRFQLRGITRWGWSRNRAGLDELGRIPSEQKEKETLWLT